MANCKYPDQDLAGVSDPAKSIEVRSVASGSGDVDRDVLSFRVFPTLSEWMMARNLVGRFESVRLDHEFPEWVEERFPPEVLSGGHRLVTSVRTVEPYSVVRRVVTDNTEYVKYFSCAAEGYREARIHEYMHSRYPDNVVPVVDSGTVGATRGVRRLPPPCLPTDCPDIEFYIVTADVGAGFVSGSSDSAVENEDVRSYVARMLRLLLDMRVAAGFTHWDLHGNNYFYNPRTKTFRILDFGFATIDSPSAVDSGTRLSRNNVVVPEEALQDFDGDRVVFGFYYDVGRVMLHSSLAVRGAIFKMHGTSMPDFLQRYRKILIGRCSRRRPSRFAFPVRLEIERFYVARFALEACIEYPWLCKRSDIVSAGVGPPASSGRPFPRLLAPVDLDAFSLDRDLISGDRNYRVQQPATEEPPPAKRPRSFCPVQKERIVPVRID